jgi:hypothetical protein
MCPFIDDTEDGCWALRGSAHPFVFRQKTVKGIFFGRNDKREVAFKG